MPIERSKIHPTVKIWHPELVNIYDSEIGEDTKIASFVEIGGAKIGKHCKIEAFAFMPPGTEISDYVFVGPGACFTNDRHPDLFEAQWHSQPVKVRRGAKICTNATILAGVVIGEYAVVGAGSVVTKDVPDAATVYGNPARVKLRFPLSKLVDIEEQT